VRHQKETVGQFVTVPFEFQKLHYDMVMDGNPVEWALDGTRHCDPARLSMRIPAFIRTTWLLVRAQLSKPGQGQVQLGRMRWQAPFCFSRMPDGSLFTAIRYGACSVFLACFMAGVDSRTSSDGDQGRVTYANLNADTAVVAWSLDEWYGLAVRSWGLDATGVPDRSAAVF
jgi:hypothetical protein